MAICTFAADTARARAAGDQFVLEDIVADTAPAGAAVLDGPARRAVALGMEDGLPVLAVLLARGQPGHDLGLDAGRQVIGDEGADVIAEGAVFGARVEVHGVIFGWRRSGDATIK